jgi:hypothetical protein
MVNGGAIEILKCGNPVKPTALQALNRLITLKKIERLGMGRGTRYRKV